VSAAGARWRPGPQTGVWLLLAIATTLFTWPLAGSPGRAISMREDYFLNLWNIWWVKQVLFTPGLRDLSLYHTDFLHFPVGVSLVRHVLNPVSAIPGALLSFALDSHDVYKVLVWTHFWLSAGVFYLFARALTASTGGALLAGLFWSFSPFHFFYLAQLNVLSMEFLPLAGLFMVRAYRDGRAGNALGVGVAAALLAGSSPYSLVYAGLLGAILLVAGPLWSPETDWRRGATRLAGAGALALCAVLAVSWRTLLAGGPAEADASAIAESTRQLTERANDLLGFLWAVPPERVVIAWPAMLGYVSLALLASAVRATRERLFWLGFSLLFAVLSLGAELHVAGHETGIPLPYRLFADLPVLWMLRKPDRIFAMVLLGAGVLLAFGWRDLAERLGRPERRRAAWIAIAVLSCLERSAIPLETFETPVSSYLRDLSHDDTVSAVVELPPYGGGPAAATSNYFQTLHGKKVTQGYVVNLELGPAHRQASLRWWKAYQALSDGDPGPVVARARATGVDRLILHKATPVIRRPEALDGRTLWSPFAVNGRTLVGLRQRGLFSERAVPAERIDLQRRLLTERLGEPEFEDDAIIVFRSADGGGG